VVVDGRRCPRSSATTSTVMLDRSDVDETASSSPSTIVATVVRRIVVSALLSSALGGGLADTEHHHYYHHHHQQQNPHHLSHRHQCPPITVSNYQSLRVVTRTTGDPYLMIIIPSQEFIWSVGVSINKLKSTCTRQCYLRPLQYAHSCKSGDPDDKSTVFATKNETGLNKVHSSNGSFRNNSQRFTVLCSIHCNL